MLQVTALESLVPVLIAGADAREFMSGQLTGDLKQLSPHRAVWGARCSGQGRVQAVLTFLERAEGIVAVFPKALLETELARLRATTLSSKVNFELAPFGVAPLAEADAAALVGELPKAPGECKTAARATLVRWWGIEPRYVVVTHQSDMAAPGAEPRSDATARELAWRRSNVVAGLPEIYAATQRSFVPQMLNLDVLNGISFTKGCYVGQEVVARARRGGVSRRMFGFSAVCEAAPPGTLVITGDLEVGEVVDAVTSETGCDLLAVVDLDQLRARLTLRGFEGAELSRTSLPYAVPEERAPSPQKRL